MKKLVFLLTVFLMSMLIVLNSIAATGINHAISDTTPSIKMIRVSNRKLIEGDLMYATADSLYILPGTKRDAKNGLFYQQMVIPYTDVYLIRIRASGWVGPILLGSAGIILLILGISGKISLLDSLENLVFILLSPVVFATGVFQLLRRKQYFINGDRERYEKFRSKLKKRK
ncbi:MAG: hypothetical protein IPK31_06675 [Chitinophagaceae bacterium]|nr:hypothetical protein [Chitinophagaceae bacterium]